MLYQFAAPADREGARHDASHAATIVGSPGWDAMEDIFKAITLWLATGTEAAAALIIGLAAIAGTVAALALFLPGASRGGGVGEPADRKEEVRLRLGRWLAVALEFELAADILRTAVAPTWNEIGQLAAIAVLRTALNYFLQQEIDKAQSRNTIPASVASSAVPGR